MRQITVIQPNQALRVGHSGNNEILLPNDKNKDRISRLRLFVDWLDNTQDMWFDTDFSVYRDFLLNERDLEPSSVVSHLGTIRAHYRKLLRANWFVDTLNARFRAEHPEWSEADIHANVERFMRRIENMIDPENAPVDAVRKTDQSDDDRHRLSPAQLQQLFNRLGTDKLSDLRDLAIFSLFVCTGIREGELVNLHVADLRASYSRQLALEVRQGKGSKQRMIPYGAMDWCLVVIDKWLERAGITEGPVFRRVRKNDRVETGALTTRSIERIVGAHPIVINGKSITLKPHDLRATYALNCHLIGMRREAIMRNMGHARYETTLGYIGRLDGKRRAPKSGFFVFDVSKLG